MTWIPLLLSDPSPCLRYIVLKDLLNNDDEASELEALREEDPLVKEVVKLQKPNGSWGKEAQLGNAPADNVQVTSQILTRLGYLGFGAEFSPVERGVEYLYSQQLEDGSWPLHNLREQDGMDHYDVISLQTSIPLKGLSWCGYAEDQRSEKAYDWLMKQRLEDGAWPTGISQGVYGGVAGYRRLAHSRWGCRSNTTSAVMCLSHHTERRRAPETRKALDLLLGRETRERQYLGYEVARTIGAEANAGFLTHYLRFDIAQILNLCARTNLTIDDPRVKEMVEYVKTVKGKYGLWIYSQKPQASRWVTMDILRSLSELDKESDWVGVEPRTPFQPYPHRRKRF